MAARQTVLENIDRAPWWPKLWTEFALLLADLESDAKYSERARYIDELMADGRSPKADQIYFVLHIRIREVIEIRLEEQRQQLRRLESLGPNPGHKGVGNVSPK